MVEPRIEHEAYCSGHHVVRLDGARECLVGDSPVPEFDVRAPYALAALAELEDALHSTAFYGSHNVRATIAESILSSAKAKLTASAQRDALARSVPAPTEDFLGAARALIAEAAAINVRLGVAYENAFIRMLRGLVGRVEADARKLAAAKTLVLDAEKQRDAAMAERDVTMQRLRSLETSRDRARGAARELKAALAAAGETSDELEAFLSSTDTAIPNSNGAAQKEPR